jgi:hypothetical protein
MSHRHLAQLLLLKQKIKILLPSGVHKISYLRIHTCLLNWLPHQRKKTT